MCTEGAKMRHGTTKLNEVDYQTRLAPAQPWDQGPPAINTPDVYGASPGKDFLYLIPTVGERPLRFSAENLPAGLLLDADSGQIRGKAAVTGEYAVRLTAENPLGNCAKTLTLILRENALALTPPMGWNSWNCYRAEIDDAKIRDIADGMIASGLAARGYCYVNMDSGWQGKQRGGKHNAIVPKPEFPDMKALCDHIHALGLKAGIYSGPYVTPCGTSGCGTTSGNVDTNFVLSPSCLWGRQRYIGLNKHEKEDVAQWAEWGFDYFKYDWGPTDMVLAERMSRELRKCPRDIVFSLTTEVHHKDADKVKELANLWRNNSDTKPNWDSVLQNGFHNEEWNSVIGPGCWFDLDMTALLPRDGASLSRNELIACITCWMMRPSPILLDCEPTKLDDLTKSLLCNEEVIAVNQDALGKPAIGIIVPKKGMPKSEIWEVQLKPLADGSYALAFFNLGILPGIAPRIDLACFGVGRTFRVRDLWNKQDLGEFSHDFVVGVEAHCAKLFKINSN